MTLQNELVEKVLMAQFGDEINELKKYLQEDIKIKAKETEERIIQFSTSNPNRIKPNADYLKELNKLSRKVEVDILNVSANDIENLELVHFTKAFEIKTINDYLQYKRELNKKEAQEQLLKEQKKFAELQEKTKELEVQIKNNIKDMGATRVSLGDKITISGGIIKALNKIDTDGLTTTLHNGEKVLTSDEIGNMHVKGNIEFSDAKVKQPEDDKAHGTDIDENEQIDQVLDEVGKIFNIVFNINHESDIKQIAKKIAERMKDTRGKF